MAEYTLTVLDTPGIQSYIFASNRLRENVGASELVRRATETWPLELVDKIGRSNVDDPDAHDPTGRLKEELRIEDGELDVEVVFVGGGNTVLLFRERTDAVALVTRLSRKLLAEAPGLGLVATHTTVNWEEDDLGKRLDDALQALAQRKAAVPHGQPQLGLGVTAECRSTGLVATTTNAGRKPQEEPEFPISDEVAGKLEAVEAANRRLRAFLSEEMRRAGWEFPLDFDHFGRSEGEMSYIAVVHADGNEMGRFFQAIREQAEGPRDYIRRMRRASHQVEVASTAALEALLLDLVNSFEHDADGNLTVGGVVPLYDNKLPFRPLVFGGDDVTFVSDGRLGLTLAARYLELFEEESRKRGLELYACGGVAVVKSHYPFARAYELGGELTKAAKSVARAKARGELSVLDWHFAASGLLGNLQEIRGREYTVGDGTLTLRPLVLEGRGVGTWETFTEVVTVFKEPKWEQHKNKLLALREVLRQGQAATRVFLDTLGEKLPTLDRRNPDWQETGWVGHQCGYFDAIEALDFYVPLKVAKEGSDAEV